MEADDVLEITRVKAYRYRMPLKRAYGTARGRTTESTNFVVAIDAQMGKRSYRGYGECQPRHSLTGDGAKDRNSAWRFLCSAADAIAGARISVATPEIGVDSIRNLMAEMSNLAESAASTIHGPKPFRGTLLGIEVALLDSVSRAHDLRISQLLGEQRDEIEVSISTISTTIAEAQVADKAARMKRFPMTRLKGVEDGERNLRLLREATRGNRRTGAEKPLWIDLNEAMDFESSCAFIEAVAAEMAQGTIAQSLTIEGPLPKKDGLQHADLQLFADQIVDSYKGQEALSIEIMPDESMWDAEDFRHLAQQGAVRAINIKAPKAGGLLPSLDLARAAVAANPEVKICIGGMLGTSELTAWALHNLARAMPRIDYITTVPPRNVEPIASPRAAYLRPGSAIIAPQREPGLGTKLDMEKIQPYLVDSYTAKPEITSVEPARKSEGESAAPKTGRSKSSWHVSISGPAVQRVGYRRWLQSLAESRGISGWVRNRHDGTVEALLRGTRKSLNSVLPLILVGPSKAVVEKVDFCQSETIPYSGFRVRPDLEAEPSEGRSSAQGVIRTISDAWRRLGGRRDFQSMATRDVPVAAPLDGRGVSLRELGSELGGSWIGNVDLGLKVRAASFLPKRLPESALLVVMHGPSWTDRLKASARQNSSSSLNIVRAGAAKGAIAAVATEAISGSPIPVHVVENSREALWRVADYARRRYRNPVVGVTGTVGKSTTVELLTYVLSGDQDVLSSEGNWNTVDGVSNTLAGLLRNPDVAVVEAAISGFVRIPNRSTAEMIRPDVAVVTSIGTAHLDVAPTLKDTARIKGKLVEAINPGGVAVLNADAPYYRYLRRAASRAGASEVRTFGRARGADFRLIEWEREGRDTRVKVVAEGREVEYRLHALGEGIAINSVGVLAAARALGRESDDVIDRFGTFQPKDNVLGLHEVSVEGGTALLIDDSTNATVTSTRAAIALLGELALERGGRAVAVLGQINFLGDRAQELHASLAGPLQDAGAEVVLTMGSGMDRLRERLGSGIAKSLPPEASPRTVVSEVRSVLRPGDVVLLKGSNVGTGFRRVASLLRRS